MKSILFLAGFALASLGLGQNLTLGSKKFTESYVLSEIARTKLQAAGFQVEHKQGMGGTIVLWQALSSGQIAAYPEYTGTIVEEILKEKGKKLDDAALNAELAKFGVAATHQLGFNNTYAIVMTETRAKALGITKISDLVRHPELKAGITHEFLGRADGWKPLAAAYGFNLADVKGIDHGLGYEALARGDIDLKDAYSTDAKIADNHLIVLDDDKSFFPQYKAVFLYRKELPEKAVQALESIAGSLDERRMTSLNASAEHSKNYSLAAAEYFAQDAAKSGDKASAKPPVAAPSEDLTGALLHQLGQHLILVFSSLLLATLVGIPLGIWASRSPTIGQVVLGLVGVIQTIPSLALLAFLVPLLGITTKTAIVALFLYSLLPIVRNTATGLLEIPIQLRESAAALGLAEGVKFRKIFLPMASRSILAGVKTSAVINVGTATLAALIGAGGFGEPIVSGLNLNDAPTILRGAIPAAVLALVVQWAFDGLDRVLVPKGLRIKASGL